LICKPDEVETASESAARMAVELHSAGRRGPLRPSELAEAAVLGDLALVMEVIAWFAPIGIAGLFQALAVVPFAVLAARHRLRAGLVSAVSASTVAGLVGGIGIMVPVAIASGLGLAAGIAFRRRWGSLTTVGFTALVVGVPLALLTVALDTASPGYRKLSFAQLKIGWKLIGDVLRAIRLDAVAQRGTTTLTWAIAHWWVSLPGAELALVVLVALGCLRLRPLLVEVRRHVPAPVADEAVERRHASPASPATLLVEPQPVPVHLTNVSYRYPGTERDALVDVSLTLEPGRFLAVVGPNGCGKSTLVRLLAGRIEPRNGTVSRLGPAGLGRVGGTAIVFQRPESQVLGVRVRDDVIWGLPADAHPDVAGLLARVGLGGFEERETSTMSGGELQRLAIAAALARSPKLLVSDESTAMIDREGRSEVVALLRELASSGLAVIHVTHRAEEAAVADEVLEMTVRRDAADARQPPATAPMLALSPKPTPRSRRTLFTRPGAMPPAGASSAQLAGAASDMALPPATLPAQPPATPTLPGAGARRGTDPLVRLAKVGYVYSQGSPWAHRALQDIDLDLWRGDGVVLTGPNGSGKSTLAWLLAGLTVATEGEALLDGAPIGDSPGRVGISFQHARLQLLRPTVLADVKLGADEDRARRAMLSVGLDPDKMGPRRVDDLSGGEQRRVALAGLLVRQPDLIVLDEPYAGLDDEARTSLARTLESLRRLSGVAVVVVTHDLDNAEVLGERLIHLAGGRIVNEESLVRLP
jgi:energy-coupling factor transport system ATP-binding protein